LIHDDTKTRPAYHGKKKYKQLQEIKRPDESFIMEQMNGLYNPSCQQDQKHNTTPTKKEE
jgi:hypothetical protein